MFCWCKTQTYQEENYMQSKKTIIVGGITGFVIPIILFVFDLHKLPFIELLGIGIFIGLIIGLLIRGGSKLMSKSKSQNEKAS